MLGTTAHPSRLGPPQAIRNLLMDLEDTGHLTRTSFLIRDRDAKYPALIDQILGSARIDTVLTGVGPSRPCCSQCAHSAPGVDLEQSTGLHLTSVITNRYS
ncbi:hypothetical protein LX90_009300 [Lentzea flava]|nr:hypothetical protein [Lentzea flava]